MVDRTFSRLPRLYVPFDLAPDATQHLDKNQSNYLAAVLRQKPGAEIIVFNGRDGAWRATLATSNKKSLEIKVQTQITPQTHPIDLTYLFAPLKTGRLDYMVQKATEMGVAAMQPVLTDFTQSPKIKMDRIRANCIEAAEQCEILSVPDVHAPIKLSDMLDQWDGHRALIFCDEAAPEQNPLDALAPLKGQPLALLIGPEGGFSPNERAALQACKFVTPISLGPRIMRADTAAVAALALVQVVAGDWQSAKS